MSERLQFDEDVHADEGIERKPTGQNGVEIWTFPEGHDLAGRWKVWRSTYMMERID